MSRLTSPIGDRPLVSGGSPDSGGDTYPWISAKDALFGATGDGITDDTVALQAFIDYCITNARTGFIPSGQYKISDTLKFGYGAVSYATVVIHGEKCARLDQSYSMAQAGGVVIDASGFADRPAINFQGAQKARLSGVFVLGANTGTPVSSSLTPPSRVIADYRKTGLSMTIGQWNPYVGVAVNAYGGTAPAVPYTNDPYGRQQSAFVVLEDFWVGGFEVGVGMNLSGAGGLGTSVTLRDGVVESCVWGVSTTDPNARNLNLYNVDTSLCWSGITNCTHGNKKGFGWNVVGGEWNTCYRWFDADQSVSAASFTGVSGEIVGTVGRWGVAAAAGCCPLKLTACTLYLASFGVEPMVKLSAYGPVEFDSCTFAGEMAILGVVGTHTPVFRNCLLQAQAIYNDKHWAGPALWAAGSTNLNGFPEYRRCQIVLAETANHDSRMPGANPIVAIDASAATARVELDRATAIVNLAGNVYRVRHPSTRPYVAVPTSALSVSSATPSTAGELVVGDVLGWTNDPAAPGSGNDQRVIPALRVTAVSGAATLEKLCDSADYASTNLDTSNAYVFDSRWAPDPRTAFTGTWSAASTTITTNRDPRTVVNVGDFISADAGLAANTRVTAVSSTTITISKATAAAGSATALFWNRLVLEAPLRAALGADVSTTLNSLQDGLLLDLPAAGRYLIDAQIFTITASGTVGLQVALAFTGTATVTYTGQVFNSSGTITGTALRTAFAGLIGQSNLGNATPGGGGRIVGVIDVTVPGTLKLQYQSGVAASSVTLKAPTTLTATQL